MLSNNLFSLFYVSSNPRMLSPEFSDFSSDTVFDWTVNLKKEIIPEQCTYNKSAYKLELKLKKKKPFKWDTIEESKPKILKDQLQEINLARLPLAPTNVWIPAAPMERDVIPNDSNYSNNL